MNGEYSEKLTSGGELKVSVNSWHILYYFSGPDLRYNGTFVRVDGKDVDRYIDAWENNFNKYLQLKGTIPPGGQFETKGLMGMSIRIGFVEGVCLRSYHMPINSQTKLNQVIKDYKYAKERAIKLQEMLRLL